MSLRHLRTQFLALARSKSAAVLVDTTASLDLSEEIRRSLIEIMAATNNTEIETIDASKRKTRADPFAVDTITRNLVISAILYAKPLTGLKKSLCVFAVSKVMIRSFFL